MHQEYAAAHRRHHTTVGQTTPLQLSYRDLPEDFDPTVTPFKVTGTDTERSAALLVIHGNHGHTLYSFRDKRRSLSKFAVFSNPRVFNPRPPLREFPLEYCNVGSAQKHQSLMPLPGRWKEFDDMRIRFDTIPRSVTDRRTDGFAVTISCSASTDMLTRDINCRRFNVL